MVDLKAKPFYLNDEEVRWVEDTLASMTLREKLSQLFVLLKAVPGVSEGQIRSLMETARPGGMKVACLGDAALNKAGDWNMQSIRELLDIVKE